jgi:Calcineurin-like phosphoesterase
MIAILHLSDMHIDSARHPLLNRAERIARAVSSTGHAISHILLVVTGDIAQSGTQAQYEASKVFFNKLATSLNQALPAVEIFYVFIPGNHDCDLTSASDVRQQDVIEPKLPNLDLNGDLVRHFLDVQRQFFKFTALYECQSFAEPRQQLCHRRVFRIPGTTICFNCFNTAWLTQNPERPAHLYFPLEALDCLKEQVDYDLNISIFHHPFNWLNPNNAQAFKHAVEGISDLMLTGHEHVGDMYEKRRPGDEIVHFVEAGALWEPKSRESAFGLLLYDLTARRYKAVSFRWLDGLYLSRIVSDWDDFERNRAARKGQFENNPAFLRKLNELGTGFSHRLHLRELTLRDLFVFPELRQRFLQAGIEGKSKTRIRSAGVLDFVKENKLVLVVGASNSGKTCLAKVLYSDLQRDNLVPILVDGPSLRGNEAQVLNTLHRIYCEQYSADSLELYKQLDPARRLIIVDDLHKSRLTVFEQHNVLAILHRLAETVIVFVNESAFQIEELAQRATPSAPFAAYEQYEILPLCSSLRTQLISRWVELGINGDTTEEEIAREIKEREKVLSVFLTNQSLPPIPIFVLGLLQAYEANTNLNTANGSYGELWESLVTERLRRVSKFKPLDISTKNAYLSRMAYFLFLHDKRLLSTQDMGDIRQAYLLEFDIDIDSTRILADLVTAEILTMSDGNYRFKYPSYYYFFVARHFKDSIGDPTEAPRVRKTVRDIADHLYYEPYVNILILYLYFTRDMETIEYILANAKKIYQNYPVCLLEEEVEFINKLNMEPAKPIQIARAELDERRRQHKDEIDEAEVNTPASAPDDQDREISYNEELNDLVKINIAFKTLQVLGQVLRNFPNLLRADPKTRVTQECYWLGLRVLSVVMKVSQDNLEGLREYFSLLIKEQRSILSENELATATDGFLVHIVGGCAYSVIKRVSLAAGSEELGETYKNVIRLDDGKTSVALIDLSIKLDHFAAFPLNEVEALFRRTEKNKFWVFVESCG